MKLLLTIADVSPKTWSRDIMSQPMVLGRDESADIRFEHRSVSRQHCRFWVEDGECFVEDCQSMNGTYVNATRIDKCKLQSGDRLLIGKFDLLVAKDSELGDTVEGNFVETTQVIDRHPADEIRHLATAVHDRLTPSRRIGLPGMLIEVGYSPTGELGGDCFQCLEAGDRWVLAIFDSMHHGIKSALALTLLRSELERCVSLTAQPSRCLDWLNNELLTLGISELYVCGCIVTWFPQTQLLYYSTAGLHPPVLLRSDQEFEIAETAHGMPLGVAIEERYEEKLIQMKHKDRFFLFSDGITDTVSREDDRPVGRRIAHELLKGHDRELGQQVQKFVAAVDEQKRDDRLRGLCDFVAGSGSCEPSLTFFADFRDPPETVVRCQQYSAATADSLLYYAFPNSDETGYNTANLDRKISEEINQPMRNRVPAVIWFTVMFIGVAGCRTAQTAFQVDSDSRTPSVGLMLAPKRQQPDVTGIRQTSAEVVEPTLADRRPRNTTIVRPRWPKLLGQMASPQRIPLPRTDLDRPAAEQPSAD